MMRRRQVLAAATTLVATTAVGCLGDDDRAEGDDDDPLDVDPETLLLDVDTTEAVLDGSYSIFNPDPDDQPIAFRDVHEVIGLAPWDEDDPAPISYLPVKSGVWLFDTVSEAEALYDELVEPFTFGHGVEPEPIAVEGHNGSIHLGSGFQMDLYGFASFRDANAVGVVTYRTDVEEARMILRARDLAIAKHETWRG